MNINFIVKHDILYILDFFAQIQKRNEIYMNIIKNTDDINYIRID